MANKNNGSNKQYYSTTTNPSKPVEAYCGILEVVPGNSSQRISMPEVAYSGFAQAVSHPGNYQAITKQTTVDKQTGDYGCYTKKETSSTGEIHRERGKGAVGVRDEYKNATTYKFGNKTGYTEIYKEERVRQVYYDNTKNAVSTKSAQRNNKNVGGAGGEQQYDDYYC